MSKKIYRYESWIASRSIDEIMEKLDGLYKEGWEVISHNQGQYGMSVILKKLKKEGG